MAAVGLKRSEQFSWKTHVEQILELCARLIACRNAQGQVQTAAGTDSSWANPE